MKISVIGAGYVGLGNALTFAKNYEIHISDKSQQRIRELRQRISPIQDKAISNSLKKFSSKIKVFNDNKSCFAETSFCIICTPTNLKSKDQSFDTSSIRKVLSELNEEKYEGIIVIRSTVPIGFCSEMHKIFNKLKIVFFPEFLREGKVMEDSTNPSRIIGGGEKSNVLKFIKLLRGSIKSNKIPSLAVKFEEAEAIKLFANTFLAMRIAFFNELDTFSLTNELDSKKIIQGVSLDNRIGNYYNNPSFGYGGYCLPKDAKQLVTNYKGVPQALIKATDTSNAIRKKFISNEIVKTRAKKIGFYKLAMKKGSDNHRNSSVLTIMRSLKRNNFSISIFDPVLTKNTYHGIQVFKDFDEFIKSIDLIIANRTDKKILNSGKKIFTRDIFNIN